MSKTAVGVAVVRSGSATKREMEPQGRTVTLGATRRNRVPSASVVIVNNLRAELGEREVSKILRIIQHEIRPALRVRVAAESERALLRTKNAARVEGKKAAVFANSVNSDAAGKFISRSRPIVNKLAESGELLAVRDGRALRFPSWQFDANSEDGLVPGLRRVLLVMDASPFRKAAWLISENPRLDGYAPIEVLRAGESDRVFEEAKAVIGG